MFFAAISYQRTILFLISQCITTQLQEKTEDSMQGRIFGLLGSIYSGFLPIGIAMFGPLAVNRVIPISYLIYSSATSHSLSQSSFDA